MSTVAAAWPRLGVGCAALGQPDVSDHDAQATLARALECGIRLFDVAPLYGGGLAERRLGRALRGAARDEIVVTTKTGVTRPAGQGATPLGATQRRAADRWNYSAAATRASVEHSLERLGLSRMDAVHLHDVEHHVEVCLEAHDALGQMRAEGLVGAIGIGSNEVAPVATLVSRARFDVILLAGRYTLLDDSGVALIAAAAQGGIAVVAAGVFNSGVLAAWPQAAPLFAYEPASAHVLERTARIAAVCERHRIPLAAAALQFVARNPAVHTVLLGPRSPAELDANLAAMRTEIPPGFWIELAGTDTRVKTHDHR